MNSVLGTMVMYSLSSSLRIDWNELEKAMAINGCPEDFAPMPAPNRRLTSFLEVKAVRRGIMKAVELCDGVNIRDNGGVVYIPEESLPLWTAFEKAITSFDGVNMVKADIATTDANKKLIGMGVLAETREGLAEEIKRIWKGTLNERNKPEGNLKQLTGLFIQEIRECYVSLQQSTNMAIRLEKMKQKATFYEGVLAISMGYVTDNIQQAIEELNTIIEARKYERMIDF